MIIEGHTLSQWVLAALTAPVAPTLIKWLLVCWLALHWEQRTRLMKSNAPGAGHFGDEKHNEHETE